MFILLAGTSRAARPAEICVNCAGPDASYACVVNGGGAPTNNSSLNLYCISALAQSGPHQSCSIDRNSVAPCKGIRKELPAPAAFSLTPDHQDGANAGTSGAAPPPQSTATDPGHADSDGGDHTKPGAPDGPPKTVEEMVEKGAQSAGKNISDANKSAGDTMKKAGSAVGNAAKSTWKCLSSFFSDC